MPTTRVTPTHGDGTRALMALSRWASRHVEKNTSYSKKAITPAALIENTHTRQLVAREKPDEVVSFGTSWNYSVFASTKEDAVSGRATARVWSYKFDSTSVTWRAMASFLRVPNFPECFLYKSECPGKTISGDVAFNMVDSLVNTVAKYNNDQKQLGTTHLGPAGLTLRTANEYVDRVHQFILPSWFININWRTNQALYYSPELLTKTNARTLCFPAVGGNTRVPRFCSELWTNFDRSCAPRDLEGRGARLLYVHTIERLHAVQTRFPNATVDLTFLESQEDVQVCRGGLTSLGFRRSDVSAVIRARNCSNTNKPSSCETVFVEDYRYETGLLISDVVQWYRVVAALRVIGQGYFLLRGVGLMLSCYFVHGTPKSQKKISTWTRLVKARHLFMKVPTQCVVFGSPFPVSCYVFAHLLDAPFTYDVLESHFFSQGGVLDIHLEAFVSYAVVQMRNVWIYALAWHIMVSVTTSRWLARNNQLSSGIIGVPEFLLSAFSSITLVAQYRSTSFRSSNILSIVVMPDNLARTWVATKYQYGFTHRGSGNVLLGGVMIDLKFLICLVFVIAGAWFSRIIWINYIVGGDKYRFSHWFILAPTPVPYSAGVLWPTVSMCVHWTSDFFCIRDNQQRRKLLQQQQPRQLPPRKMQMQGSRNGEGRIVPFTASFRAKQLAVEQLRLRIQRYKYSTPSALMNVNTFRYIQHQMQCLHRRSDDVEANVAFMNAVVMSDPIVYLRTLLGRDRSTELAYYQSLLRPHQIVLLPVVVVGDHNDLKDLAPTKTKRASENAARSFLKFLEEENVSWKYLEVFMVRESAPLVLESVVEKFGMYLAFKEVRKGQLLARHAVMQCYRQAKNWLLEQFPQHRLAVDKALLKKDQVLERYCMKRESGAFVNKAPACTKKALKKIMTYLYFSASSTVDYQDAALLYLMWFLFGRASHLTQLRKANLSIFSRDIFVRLIRVTTSEEQGLSLFPDEDFSTCPLLAIALAFASQSSLTTSLLSKLPVHQAASRVSLTPATPLIDLMDHPESMPDGQSSNKQPGGAQNANEAGMCVQWIFDRGAWNMTAQNKVFAYVFNTPSEDHKFARVLSSRHQDQVVALLSLGRFASDTQAKIRFVTEALFAGSVGLETAQYNVNGRILDTLMAYLLRHYPGVKKLNPDGLAIKRLEACAVGKGFPVNTLLSWSSHLVCDPNTSSAPKPGESQYPATDITQTPLFRHQAALFEQLIEVNQKLDARMTTMEDAFYNRQQRKRKKNDACESIASEPPAKRKHRCKRRIELEDIREGISAPGPSTEADAEAEWSNENDLSEQPLHAVRKVLDRKRLNRKTYYVVDWEPTWEPREHMAQTLIAGFERERRVLVRKTYIEYEAVEDNTLNRTE
ncbi:unnamed protein product [Phytophthora fragariaefolia]|uniref:Unnamed protein product n=1 Tax=Phytophthora fragariaefolia TaxID=1490495 RepID=A0A9W6XE61_9STRA|nr:unnamed protein product [Phytophthora fragariaefolia]